MLPSQRLHRLHRESTHANSTAFHIISCNCIPHYSMLLHAFLIPLYSILFHAIPCYSIVFHAIPCYCIPLEVPFWHSHPPTLFFPVRDAFLKPSLPMPHRCPRWPPRAILARRAAFRVFGSPVRRAISSCSTSFCCYSIVFHIIPYYSIVFHC